jgi:hypothetical protein
MEFLYIGIKSLKPGYRAIYSLQTPPIGLLPGTPMKAPTWVPPYRAITRDPYESPHLGTPLTGYYPGPLLKPPILGTPLTGYYPGPNRKPLNEKRDAPHVYNEKSADFDFPLYCKKIEMYKEIKMKDSEQGIKDERNKDYEADTEQR